MAEFCWECWNKINGMNVPKWGYRLSWSRELCEECEQMKRVVVGMKRSYLEWEQNIEWEK